MLNDAFAIMYVYSNFCNAVCCCMATGGFYVYNCVQKRPPKSPKGELERLIYNF